MRMLGRSVRFVATASLVAGTLLAGPGAASVAAASPKPAVHTLLPHIAGDVTGIDISLPLGQTISGTITDGSALPIPGMTVEACSSNDLCFTSTTAADGTYTVIGLPPTTYVVSVDASDTLDFLNSWYTPGVPVPDASTATPVDVTTANATGIDLTPLSGFSVSRTVSGAGSGALAGVEVFASGPDSSAGFTDAGGHFTIHHLINGTYQLGEYMAAGLNFVNGTVDAGTVIEEGPGSQIVVSGADLTGQDFSVPAGFRISGKLTGTGSNGAVVEPAGGPDCTCSSVSAASNGTWQLVGLWPGTYTVGFAPASVSPLDSQFPLGYWRSTGVLTPDPNLASNVVVTGADRSGINGSISAGASVSGTVGGSDGPIGAGSFVEMCGNGGIGCASTVTGASGAWSFSHVPAGTYQVQAFEHGHIAGYFGPGGYAVNSTLASTITMTGKSKSGVNVVLPAGLGISGRISGPSDEPIPNAHVTEFPGGISPGGDGITVTGAEGTYRVAGRAGGSYGLSIGVLDGSPYLSGYYDESAPGHFTPDSNLATSITIDDGVGSSYVPITPVRVVNSLTPLGVPGVFHANVPQTFAVGGVSTIPPDATAVTGNLTVVGQTAAGYVSITPTANVNPASSTVNVPFGDIRANNFTTALAPDGSLAAVYKGPTGKTAQVIVDITGYFEAGSGHATYTPVAPVRLLNSRPVNNVGLSGKFVANVPRTLAVAGVLGLPSDVTAITANVTIVNQTAAGYLSVTPGPEVNPGTSTLNFPTGDARANGLTVALSGTDISIVYKAASGTADVILDVTGYYEAGSSGLLFYALPPGRLLDSRSGVLATALAGPFTSSAPRTMVAAGRAGIPLDAAAVTGNLTVVGQTAAGYASLTETPTASPGTSTLNFPLGDTRANGITAPLDVSGELSLVYKASAGKTTQFLLDLTGYFR
jgi:hypothetical protein